MFVQSFAVKLKRVVHVACDRSFSGRSPLARAFSRWRGRALAHVPTAPRPLDCVLIAATAAALALAALLCSVAPRVGFAQVWRVGGWLP
ncbi:MULTISPECIES: hypothetical protein [Burkholderia]|jgi:hypothetical protein|uniref:Uncharacterized protein n=2 Tax=Burkholderia cenocepacia TaxID=95486 RepID=A0A142PC76_9BURK|nr:MULTISPECIES: hypothetical protein [Burkholderia]AIO44039.1 hypothetical protein DM42_5938 [Burkholderia cepacia]ALV60119.1 hypothetical protein TQ36_28755 [Burkholderia cenocepacia]AMU13216.1 hypothetical protein A3203_08885 [Burkholderia cenocepacia]AOK38668.1 hypothetical protein WL90_30875 [Burkholderia cenocepacia]AQQ21306.1 hypothetical protein A8D61_24120 [Burkholderia cenocepacia]